MSSPRRTTPAHIRFEAHDADWMIATIDDVRIVAAPVPTEQVDAAIGEIVSQLGVRAHIEIHHVDGTIDRRVAHPRQDAEPEEPRT
ncbi:MAG: hypothetical protein ACTH9B_08430 [Brevibacterium aurantiacum]|uniref:DUF2188 domain-containing protein n=1 Tax=Brevibacterium aurantiacum TaxID=273384 RepID=A0A3Q9P0E7_BREAU|nr:hypothetical protein [Brevibacterium aurantiacum]AZT97644.1 hypothetical protein CXR27_12010 [Brevibacterium aurantiacum]